LVEYAQPLPSYNQYFTDPNTGGDVWPDFCPSWQPYSNYWCRDPDVNGNSYLGENFGTNSSCFDINLGYGQTTTGCYEVKCIINDETNNTQIAFRLGETWYGCPPGIAGWTNVNTPGMGEVSVSCPNFDFFCTDKKLVRWTVSDSGARSLISLFMIATIFWLWF